MLKIEHFAHFRQRLDDLCPVQEVIRSLAEAVGICVACAVCGLLGNDDCQDVLSNVLSSLDISNISSSTKRGPGCPRVAIIPSKVGVKLLDEVEDYIHLQTSPDFSCFRQ